MFQKVKAVFLFFIIIQAFSAAAQTGSDYNANSPYSRIGIGELVPEGSIRNMGMGGTGVSNSNPNFFNLINPALLINNRVRRYDSLLSILDGGIKTELRGIKDNNGKESSGTINFFSVGYAFPLSKRWMAAVNLKPYSGVSYSFAVRSSVAGSSDSAVSTYKGNGGIYRAELANAYKINKHINLGFSASYVFGSIYHESFSYLINFADSSRVGSNRKTFYNGFLFRPGISFRKKLKESIHADSAVFINLGLTYDFFVNTRANEELFIDRRTNANYVIDRSKVSQNIGKVTFPNTWRAGISFDNHSRWNVALDFSYSAWKNFSGTSSGDTLKNTFGLAIGAELVLNHSNPLSTKYLRGGFSFNQTPVYLKGKQINDLAVSLGYSFPVGKKSTYRITRLPRPLINLALIAGKRGTLENNLVREQYIKAYIGLTINDKWFRRRKVE